MPEKWTSQQERAISSFGHNILVSAGAGSGKTAVLSQRVYYLVGKHKFDIDSLLVLTFTEKAAAEMRTRIRQKISEDKEGLFSPEEKRVQVNKIDSSFIMTFDAYAFYLVKKYHSLLGVDKDISIIDKNILYDQTQSFLDELMEEGYQKKDEAFLSLIDTFCRKDDSPIRKAILKVNDRLSSIYGREDYVNEYEDRFYSPEAFDDLLERFEDYLKEQITLLRKEVNDLSYGVENVSDYYIGLDSLFQAGNLNDILLALRNCEVTTKRLPNGSGMSEIKKNITDALSDLKKWSETSIDEMKKEIHLALPAELELLKLANKLDEKLAVYKKESGFYDFSDIFHMAIDLVVKYPKIAEEIREGFNEILIDEYQDTNDLQDEFIRRIARDNVYMVGDVKQSIYRFRNANPALFMEKYEDYKNNGKDELIELPHNFRSRKEVIEDINVIFDRTMDLLIGGARFQKEHHMVNGRNEEPFDNQNPRMEIYNYPYDKKSEPFTYLSKAAAEAFIMAKDIKDKVGHFMVKDGSRNRTAEYRDFCIIVDRTTSFDLYKQVFTYCGIPAVIEKDERMSDSDLIYALKAVFVLLEKMASNEEDEDFVYSYLSLARSFLVEEKDEVLFDIVKNQSFKDSDLYRKLQPLSEKVHLLSIGQILDEVISLFDVYDKLILIGDVKENLIKIDYIYQLSASLNQSGFDYTSFNRYLDSLFEQIDERDITYKIDQTSINAVRIINTHKSKGLQYKICYFPALDVKFNLSDMSERFAFSKKDGLITPVYIKGKGLKDTLRKLLYGQDYLRQDIGEKLRLLYVALTRSEEKMILITSLSDKSSEGEMVDEGIRMKYRSFTDLLNSIYDDLDSHGFIRDIDLSSIAFESTYAVKNERDLASYIDKTAKPIMMRNDPMIEPKPMETAHFSKSAGLIDEAMIKRMELGTTLHYYLEVLDFKTRDLSFVDAKYLPLIEKFLNSEIMKDAANGKAYKEYEFIYEEDGKEKHGFIDLLMEYDDHFDIIDYKTKNIDDEHYDEQLNGYRNYIHSISDKKVNCYLYSIIDSTYREVK